MPLEIRALSSLDKLFPDETPAACVPFTEGFCNEVISWQLALHLTEGRMPCSLTVSVDSPLSACTEIRQVRHVPVRLATYSDADDRYLRKQPGLYPDLLASPHAHSIRAFSDHWECVWLTVNPQGTVPAGTYPVTVRFHDAGGTLLGEHTQSVTLLPGLLPEHTLVPRRLPGPVLSCARVFRSALADHGKLRALCRRLRCQHAPDARAHTASGYTSRQ